jgi:hypothetical protein
MKHCILILFCLVAISSRSTTNDQPVLNNTELPQQLWHDLITPNLEESKLFYGAVFGWTFKDTNFKGTKFTTIYNNGKIIGGMIEVKSAKSSTWISALPLTSEDLNQRIKKVVAAGAKAVLPPVKIPGRGKQVVFEGLQGEEFSLISQNDYTNNMNSDLSDNNWLGMELWASNTSEAKEFYEVAFGVTTTKTTYDKKPYWLFNSGSDPVAGMMNNPIKNQGTQWVPYIKVSRLSESFMKIEKTKAYIILSPSKDVRNGEVGIIQDPHGAIIAIQNIKS